MGDRIYLKCSYNKASSSKEMEFPQLLFFSFLIFYIDSYEVNIIMLG